MNEQTTKLIEQLAQKLGTTSEYIFGVLVKQAHLSAITGVIIFALILLLDLVLIKVHFKLLKDLPKESRYANLYEKYDPEFIMIVSATILLVATICCIGNLGNVIAGFYNPEYWAINRILESISDTR